jgi:single-strand DNA-binding protein
VDRAQFEIIGNVSKIEIKQLKDGEKLALLSVATSERWKPEGKDWIEKTYWHRVAVFAPAKVTLIENAVQKGTRLRLVGQIRPSSWEDDRGMTKYGIEFVVTGLGEVGILARPKPKADAESEPTPAGEEAPRPEPKRAV